jgi:hypothetical protein
LATIARLREVPEERHSAVVEKECVGRIGREMQVR